MLVRSRPLGSWLKAVQFSKVNRKGSLPDLLDQFPFDDNAALIVDSRQEQRHAICILGLSFKDAEEALQGAVWVSDNIAVTRIN